MQALNIVEREDSPKVVFDSENNTFEIIGKSLPEDVLEFYQPLYDWAEEYVKKPNGLTELHLNVDYFNSASHKAINDVLDVFAKIKETGNKVRVVWHYLREDDDMLETGHDYAEITQLEFEFKAYD